MPARSTAGTTSLSLLAAFGTFAVFLAVLFPLVVYPRIARLPADPQATQVQTARGATVLVPDRRSSTGVRVLTGADVRTTTHVAAPRDEPFGDSVVWNLATRVTVGGKLLNARVERISLDPRTGRPTNCCGDSLRTDLVAPPEPLQHVGLLGFPFDTRPRDYAVWDVSLRGTRVARFAGEERWRGLRVYRFMARNEFRPTGTQDLPGALFGSAAPSVRATAEYADTRTFWIEPASGATVDLRDQVQQRFRSGSRTVTALSALLVAEPPTEEAVSRLRAGATVLPWLRSRASWVLGPLGVLMLVLAGLLHRRRTRDAAPGGRRARDGAGGSGTAGNGGPDGRGVESRGMDGGPDRDPDGVPDGSPDGVPDGSPDGVPDGRAGDRVDAA